MSAITTQPIAEPLPWSLPRPIVWLTAAVLFTAFLVIEHGNTEISRWEAYTRAGDEAAARTAEGDLGRRIAMPGLALFGAALLLLRKGARIQGRTPLAWLLLGYLLWCLATLLWSIDPPLTMRRLGVLMLGSVAALGIARQISLRDLCLVALVTTTIFVANGIRTEIALGTFHPWAADYRFAGTLHPNAQAPYCATMALAAACLAGRAGRGRVLLWLWCAAGVGLLILTKSRTVCGAFLVGLAAVGFTGVAWRKKTLVVAGLLWLACMAALYGTFLGWDVQTKGFSAVMIGRQEEAGTLSGRVPLWQALVPFIEERPFLGYGFQTFWTPERIESFSRSFQWTVPDGHSAYLDTVLDLGLVGAALCFVAVLVALRRTARGYSANSDVGFAFLLALIACRLFNAFLESGFSVMTGFLSFIMVCGVVRLAFYYESEAAGHSENTTGESLA